MNTSLSIAFLLAASAVGSGSSIPNAAESQPNEPKSRARALVLSDLYGVCLRERVGLMHTTTSLGDSAQGEFSFEAGNPSLTIKYSIASKLDVRGVEFRSEAVESGGKSLEVDAGTFANQQVYRRNAGQGLGNLVLIVSFDSKSDRSRTFAKRLILWAEKCEVIISPSESKPPRP